MRSSRIILLAFLACQDLLMLRARRPRVGSHEDHVGYFSLPKSKAGALASWSFVRSVVNFASLPTLI